jgi:hypothetical protein
MNFTTLSTCGGNFFFVAISILFLVQSFQSSLHLISSVLVQLPLSCIIVRENQVFLSSLVIKFLLKTSYFLSKSQTNSFSFFSQSWKDFLIKSHIFAPIHTQVSRKFFTNFHISLNQLLIDSKNHFSFTSLYGVGQLLAYIFCVK